MKVIKIAVWGLGRHALLRVIPAITFIKDLSLFGVYSRNIDSVMETSTEWGCFGYSTQKQMLQDPQVDVIYIATPIGIHADQVALALEAGKHVWCEKPLTCSYEDTKRLVSSAKKNNRMLVEAFMYLYHPQFRKLKSFVDDKSNGRLFSISCKFGMPLLDKPGFRYNSSLGGGAFWDIASYPVSILVALMMSHDAEVLFSEILTKSNNSVDTEGRALLRLSNDTSAYLEWGMELGYKNEIDLWSQKGSFFTDKIFSKPEGYQPEYRIRDINGNESFEEGETSEQFIDMFKSFKTIYDSSALISDEYQLILKRARILNQILRYATNENETQNKIN